MKRTTTLLAILALCLLLFGRARGMDSGSPTEYQVKAVFLYNIMSFVEWPDSAFESSGQPLKITILGTDPFGTVLDDIVRGKLINGRSIVVRRANTLSEIGECQLLYVSASERDNLAAIWARVQGKPVLTVSDIDPKVSRNAVVMISVGDDNRLKLCINTGAAERAGLKISSRLLRLAEIINDE
jgi:hypothetical protein